MEASESYREIEVPEEAPDRDEPMGTKPKFWYQDSELGRCLFKQARAGTGEDWAEKAAAELATLLGIPHAVYELAKWSGIRGTVSRLFVPPEGSLRHGNELLQEQDPAYPVGGSGSRGYYRVSQHTLKRVLGVVDSPRLRPPLDWASQGPLTTAAHVFIGYLMLDAWIGNQDRHHENWGWSSFRHLGLDRRRRFILRRPTTTPRAWVGTSRTKNGNADSRREIAATASRSTLKRPGPRSMLMRVTSDR